MSCTQKSAHKSLEYNNHLTNVLTVSSDKKLYNSTAQTYSVNIVSASDYYPFGWAMYGRKNQPENYRFGFNGKENDTEYGSSQLIQDYGFRIYNPSIGRFLSVDPLSPDYPWYTPYQFAGNIPIWAVDLDGLEPFAGYLVDGVSAGAAMLGLERTAGFIESYGHSLVVDPIYSSQQAVSSIQNDPSVGNVVKNFDPTGVTAIPDQIELVQKALEGDPRAQGQLLGMAPAVVGGGITGRALTSKKTQTNTQSQQSNSKGVEVAPQQKLPILERVKKLHEGLDEAPPASNADEAIQLINRTLDQVENQYSGVPKNPDANKMPNIQDGRMYGILDDKFVTRLPNGTVIAKTRKNVIVAKKDGSFTINKRNRENKANHEIGEVQYQKKGKSDENKGNP